MIPKYRAWDRELGRMVLVKTMFFFAGELEELEVNDSVMNDYIPVYPDEIELMQSTGQTDKDGKEIFEGDILKVTNLSSWLEVVSFNNNKAMFVSKEIKREIEESPLYDLFNTDIFEVEIISNIYTNPGLAEVNS